MLAKKLIAFALALVCLFSCAVICSAANTPDPEAIKDEILSLQSEYPNGMTWTNADHGYDWFFPGTLIHMSGCASFAAVIQDAVFGSIKTTPVTWQRVTKDYNTHGIPKSSIPYSWETLFPGDILVFNGHTVIVVEKFDDHVIIAEGNYAGTVRWGRTISRKGVETAKYIWTRYDKSKSYIQVSDKNAPSWSRQALIWGNENDIIGINPYTLDSNVNCTRAEAVYALWMAHGAPSYTGSCPFVDVPNDAPYLDAIMWAYQKGVTVGTSSTTFSPNDTCTRAQGLTFIYRSINLPAPTTSENVFEDVPSDAYYKNAVNWAYENEITNGTSQTTFSPKKEVRRSEFITFLYKCFM